MKKILMDLIRPKEFSPTIEQEKMVIAMIGFACTVALIYAFFTILTN